MKHSLEIMTMDFIAEPLDFFTFEEQFQKCSIDFEKAIADLGYHDFFYKGPTNHGQGFNFIVELEKYGGFAGSCEAFVKMANCWLEAYSRNMEGKNKYSQITVFSGPAKSQLADSSEPLNLRIQGDCVSLSNALFFEFQESEPRKRGDQKHNFVCGENILKQLGLNIPQYWVRPLGLKYYAEYFEREKRFPDIF